MAIIPDYEIVKAGPDSVRPNNDYYLPWGRSFMRTNIDSVSEAHFYYSNLFNSLELPTVESHGFFDFFDGFKFLEHFPKINAE